MEYVRRPEAQGLYDPAFEKENCGVGFVANIKGKQSREIVEQGNAILVNMEHRGATGREKNTGDGAGILTAFPAKFMARVFAELLLPFYADRGTVRYASGLVFLPKDAAQRAECKELFAEACRELKLSVPGWRAVPVDNSALGKGALACEPAMEQPLVVAGKGMDDKEFERKLFVARKLATHRIRGGAGDPDRFFYVCSLSSKVMVYKGMLTTEQLFPYFADLRDRDFESHVAMVHSRFSTNTFPSWDRAQPLRFMAHNGEINTLRGNQNKMRGRQGAMASPLFGDELRKAYPIIEPDLSDSGCFDNALELLYIGGRGLPEAAMMMVPEAWQSARHMDPVKRAFYEYNSCLMEPWDGPASITFTDGVYIGALLDRNGLRPSRYYVTDDDRVIMASEVGVLPVDPARVVKKGRLEPGRMFLVNFEEGRIVADGELKMRVSAARPYGEWLKDEAIQLHDLERAPAAPAIPADALLPLLKAHGYSTEAMNLILAPMARDGKEPLGSMGNDAALAVLSAKNRLPYDYFKQMFAQVTNPPIDSIREEIVMSLECYVGPGGNILEAEKGHCRKLRVPNPVLSDEDMAAVKAMDHRDWKARVVDATFPAAEGEAGFLKALARIEDEAEAAVADGRSILVLSDRAVSKDRCPVPALIALGAAHQRLLRKEVRTKIGIFVESGEPREVHHFCMLAGYGADAVNPYLAYEAMRRLRADGYLPASMGDHELEENFVAALSKGMRKVFGKMGISTLDSYKGAQIFEAVGLAPEVVERCFEGTPSRIGGAGFAAVAREALARHAEAWPARNAPAGTEASLPSRGEYQWRQGGEKHMWDPESVANLQHAVRFGDRAAFRRFSERQDQRSREQCTLRGLLKFKKAAAVPIEEVEPVAAIVKRFVTGAMSFGSISQEAHEALAVAMNRLGGKSNTGEGGERPERFRVMGNGDSKRSAIKQVASGRFGVTAEYLTNADEIQIKMAQGAKPGEGGELPGHKVFDIIARTRHSTAGVGLISPPPHHDIYSIEDLAQLIFDLKNANPRARISVKLVSEVGVGTVASGVAKAHADHILVSGHDGGTGASPLTGIKNAGMPWELGIAEAHQNLAMNGLRSRVTLQTDGQIKTARDVAIAAMLGAEEFGVATAALVALGCVMMRKCEKNTCPVGIATQDPVLRARFAGRPEYVENLFTFIAEDLRALMASLGARSVDDLVGRVDLLEADEAVRTWKSAGLDLSALLHDCGVRGAEARRTIAQDHGLAAVLDRKLVALAAPALERGEKVAVELPIANTDRSTATMLSHEITRLYGGRGLPDGTVTFKFKGSAGQSFGAFMTRGVTLELEGDLNDYAGKGLCGGVIVAYPPKAARFRSDDNILLGNVALYGATAGKAFFRGKAAERFCVRNSGAEVAAEGCGDHGCEYMTGGRAVILGPVGRNFAAGMSGGIAYLHDPARDIEHLCNREMVGLGPVPAEDQAWLEAFVREFRDRTGSEVAASLLKVWARSLEDFVRVMPHDYRKALEKRSAQEAKQNG